MTNEKLNEAAKAAAKILFGDEVAPTQKARFTGSLEFDVTFQRSKVPAPRSFPQKARPWSLVQVLLSKLAEHVGDATVETWLEEGILQAQMLDTDEESAAKERMERLIEKLLPCTTVQPAANLLCKEATGKLAPAISKAA